MTNFSDDLRTIDPAELCPVFDALGGHEADAGRQWVGDRRHERRTDKQVLLDARRLANAIEYIGRFPEAGEAFQRVTAKRYSLWDVIRATIRLAAPARFAYLGIATLG
jgi:hypothetical protein